LTTLLVRVPDSADLDAAVDAQVAVDVVDQPTVISESLVEVPVVVPQVTVVDTVDPLKEQDTELAMEVLLLKLLTVRLQHMVVAPQVAVVAAAASVEEAMETLADLADNLPGGRRYSEIFSPTLSYSSSSSETLLRENTHWHRVSSDTLLFASAFRC
jgi:hypothetical protein